MIKRLINFFDLAYDLRGGYNFILVDSKRLSAGPWYPAAVTNTYVIGRAAASFIDYLVSRGLSLESLHLIGMSIGAHAAGIAGHFLKSGKPYRITGMLNPVFLSSKRFFKFLGFFRLGSGVPSFF